MMKRILIPAVLIVLPMLLSACPTGMPMPMSLFGSWSYFDIGGKKIATVELNSDGSMSYTSKKGSGMGIWSQDGDAISFSVMIDSSPAAQLEFAGTNFKSESIVGKTTSDQPPAKRRVVMVR